jgi:hypothetical protein
LEEAARQIRGRLVFPITRDHGDDGDLSCDSHHIQAAQQGLMIAAHPSSAAYNWLRRR